MRHIPLDRLLAELARHGVDVDRQVIVMPGAERRGARMFTEGFNRGVQCTFLHYTAERRGTRPLDSVNYILFGRGDGFVIANVYVDDPVATGLPYARLWILALWAGTYTEGAGGPLGIIPAGGANRVGLSFEIANPGGGSYHPAQTDLVCRALAAVNPLMADLNGWHDDPFGWQRISTHFIWAPGRKSDCSGLTPGRDWSLDGGKWAMPAVRRDARNLHLEATAPPPPPPAKPTPTPAPIPTEDDMHERIIWMEELRGAFILVDGRWLSCPSELYQDLKKAGWKQTNIGRHPWLREQILADIGGTSAELWRDRGDGKVVEGIA